jgi:hypothetical protein
MPGHSPKPTVSQLPVRDDPTQAHDAGHSEIIAIEGDSYRKREAQAAINNPKSARRAKPSS